MAHLLTGRMVMIGGLLALVIDATVAAYAIAVEDAETPFVRPIAGDDVIASPSDADFMADLAANVPEFRQAA
jgi:hypothetical protein